MKYKWVGFSLLIVSMFFLYSPSVRAVNCTDANCGTTYNCPNGFQTDRAGCKVCRCEPAVKTYKTWNFNAVIDCPAGKVLTQPVRFFSASWIEGQNLPNYFYWDYSGYTNDLTRTLTLKNYTTNDVLYFGMESNVMVAKKLYSGAIVQEALELSPTGTPGHIAIGYQKSFNPYTSMARYARESLPMGTYSIHFAIPEGYSSWCSNPPPTPTPIRLPTPIPPPPTGGCGNGCLSGEECYQPPMPPCPKGMACIQVMPNPYCRHTQTPDLTVLNGSITVDPVSQVIGKAVNVKFSLINQGLAAATSAEYSYTNQSGGTSTIGAGNTCSASTVLAPRASCVSSFDFTFPVVGTKTFAISIDPNNKVVESNETNNQFSKTVVITSVPITSSPTPIVDPCPKYKEGDANCDQKIDSADLDMFKMSFNGRSASPSGPSFFTDFNKDGKVDLVDFEIWRNSFYQ